MTRGTTPHYILTILDFQSVETHSLYVTIRQGCNTLTLTGDDLEVENNVINVTLTQEQSLSFKQGQAQLQLRGIDDEGVAYASDIVVVQVNPVLYQEVIT